MKDPIFESNPKLECYYKTTDGNAFFTEHDAKSYAASLKSKKVEKIDRKVTTGKLKAVKNPDTGAAKEPTPMQKAKLRKESIEKLETIEDVKNALKGETAGSVIKAGEKRIEQITALENTESDDSIDQGENTDNTASAPESATN